MSQKSTSGEIAELIEEIHESFLSAESRLLLEAKAIINNPLREITSKADRVKKLGFTSAYPVVMGQDVVSKLTASEELVKTIHYFRQHYPLNKFITEAEVKKICAKYALVFGDAANYIGDIPEKNIEEIEAFQLREEDFINSNTGMEPGNLAAILSEHLDNATRIAFGLPPIEEVEAIKSSSTTAEKESIRRMKNKNAPFKIVAPLKDFNTRSYAIKNDSNLELTIPDPVVLQPVKGGYLIVSKWGLEASDAGLVNEVLN